jgi:hypothetical protein
VAIGEEVLHPLKNSKSKEKKNLEKNDNKFFAILLKMLAPILKNFHSYSTPSPATTGCRIRTQVNM